MNCASAAKCSGHTVCLFHWQIVCLYFPSHRLIRSRLAWMDVLGSFSEMKPTVHEWMQQNHYFPVYVYNTNAQSWQTSKFVVVYFQPCGMKQIVGNLSLINLWANLYYTILLPITLRSSGFWMFGVETWPTKPQNINSTLIRGKSEPKLTSCSSEYKFHWRSFSILAVISYHSTKPRLVLIVIYRSSLFQSSSIMKSFGAR